MPNFLFTIYLQIKGLYPTLLSGRDDTALDDVEEYEDEDDEDDID